MVLSVDDVTLISIDYTGLKAFLNSVDQRILALDAQNKAKDVTIGNLTKTISVLQKDLKSLKDAHEASIASFDPVEMKGNISALQSKNSALEMIIQSNESKTRERFADVSVQIQETNDKVKMLQGKMTFVEEVG